MTFTVPSIVLPLTLLTATHALVLPAQATLTRTFASARDELRRYTLGFFEQWL